MKYITLPQQIVDKALEVLEAFQLAQEEEDN
jgi:hypothetical protein